MLPFSRRRNLLAPRQIQFRDALPTDLRIPIYEILIKHASAQFLCEEFVSILNPYGTDPLPEYEGTIQVSKGEDFPEHISLKRMLLGCEWFRVYDLVERIFQRLEFHDEELAYPGERPLALPMQRALNDYFEHVGIGWKLEDGKIIARQDQATEQSIAAAITELTRAGRPTAAGHIREAMLAISRRPRPDTSGAVAHATSALECVYHSITGEPLTLGKYLKKYPDLGHPSLKKALDGIYGFASGAGARHGREGAEPGLEEAQLVVSVCAATCSFISSRHLDGTP